MVAFPGASLRAGGDAGGVEQLRALNRPRPVRVRCDAQGQPAAILLDGGWAPVAEVADAWRLEDEWWRTPIRRRYLLLVLADGRVLTLFEDLEDPDDTRWYRQHDIPRTAARSSTGSSLMRSTPAHDRSASPAYVELHCHSCYSLREGASTPSELLSRAVELGYDTLALTDHDGLYGSMEFARAAPLHHIRPITGAELTLPDGHHLTLLVESARGYATLCRLISRQHGTPESVIMPGVAPSRPIVSTAEPTVDWEEEIAALGPDGGLIALSGCRQGAIPSLVEAGRYAEAEALARRFVELFGRGSLFIELQQNFVKGDTARNAALVDLAERLGVGIVATNNVHYHVQERSRLHDVLVAIRHRTTLDASHQLRRANSEFYLKDPEEMAELFARYPEAVVNTRRIAERCVRFNPATDLGYRFPDYPVPAGHTPDSLLAAICREAMGRRYNSYEPVSQGNAEERLAQELALIAKHKLAGFFLTYRDILALAGEVAQELRMRDPRLPPDERPVGRGRGSSVSSLVCYLIGLSHVDPVRNELFLGRFLNEELGSVPDIDIDFPRDIRAELIERMYTRYPGRVGLVNILPTYRLRSAVRDVGKALGLPLMELEKLAKLAGHWSDARSLATEMARVPEFAGRVEAPLWRDLIELTGQIAGFPRHVSQHVGGMVIAAGPLADAVPLEPARMPNRYVIQWDKDSAEDARFVKIDFLALGMLSLVDECLDTIEERHGQRVDFSHVGYEDPEVYKQICAGDTIGVFQIESRAQIQTLPRTQPRNLDDLAVEVAIVRPGPIVGGAFHPYMEYRRKLVAGEKFEIEYDDKELLEPVLKETLGVILYQEQVLQVAMAVAGFSIGEAELLRRSMSRHRSREAMEAQWPRFCDGAAHKGLDREKARRIFDRLLGFASFGFPKSHAVAFARLAYESAWLRYKYPAEYLCALFNNQPMGFYTPGVLTGDAKRHGIAVLPPEINRSGVRCTVEDGEDGAAVRLGLDRVREISAETATAIVAARDGIPFRSLFDCIQRTGLARGPVENLILAGAFDGFGLERRELLWQLGLFRVPGAGSRERGAGFCTGDTSPRGPNSPLPAPRSRQYALPLPVDGDMVPLRPMSGWDRLVAEHYAIDFSPSAHPLALLRAWLGEAVHTSRHLADLDDDAGVRLAGMVVSRQRPGTAKGVLFLLLEDEFGLTNVVVHPALYDRQRLVVRTAPFVLVDGVLQRRGPTLSVLARRFTALRPPPDLVAPPSRDFH